MGKSNKISVSFGGGNNKVKVRFSNEQQQQRVAVLVNYIQVCLQQGVTLDNLVDLMGADMNKAREVIGKISGNLPESTVPQSPHRGIPCPYGSSTCYVDWSTEWEQWACKRHGLIYLLEDGSTVSAL